MIFLGASKFCDVFEYITLVIFEHVQSLINLLGGTWNGQGEDVAAFKAMVERVKVYFPETGDKLC